MSVVELYFTDTGAGGDAGSGPRDGEALLLVHGWGSDHRTWDGVEFPGRRVVAVDLRGHGRSPVVGAAPAVTPELAPEVERDAAPDQALEQDHPAPEPPHSYRPADLAADLAALIRRLGLGPVVAVGHSMGAQVVTVLAVQYPELVAALVVADPAYGADDVEQALIPGRLAALRAHGAAAGVEMFDVPEGPIREQFLATPGFVLGDCYAGMYTDPGAFGARPASDAYLARRPCPVLSVRASEEAARWERSVARPAGSRVTVWGGVSHYLHRDRPEAFAREVDTWLGTLSPAQNLGAAS